MPAESVMPGGVELSAPESEVAIAALFDRLGAGGVEDADRLVECFAGVSDPRSRRGVRHSIETILALCAAASLSGCTSTVEITTWVAHAEQDLLVALGCRRDGTGRCVGPHADTIDRVLGLLDAQALATRVGAHLGRRAGVGPVAAPVAAPVLLPALAVDGKAVRGAIGADGQIPYLLAAATHDKATVIAERLIGAKTNEVPEFAPLLAGLPVGGWVLTMDAAHTVRAPAEFIAAELLAHFVMIARREPEGPVRASRRPGLGRRPGHPPQCRCRTRTT